MARRRAPVEFPDTIRTWIATNLEQGTAGHRAILEHLMSVYYAPLVAYARAARISPTVEPEELVHEFLAQRAARSEYLDRWRPEHMPLRRFLANGLHFSAREAERGQRAFRPRADSPVPRLETESAAEVFHRVFVVSLVQSALAAAERECSRSDLQRHWLCFVRHRQDGAPYARVGAELGIPAGRAAVMARTAAKRFEAAVREALVRDGVARSELESAIRELIDA